MSRVVFQLSIVDADPKARVCADCHGTVIAFDRYVTAKQGCAPLEYLCIPCVIIRWPRIGTALMPFERNAGHPLAKWLNQPEEKPCRKNPRRT